MRWLVEVSRVSDGSSTERYCIDARRWQSALQEVRRLRGDEGPLPKLTIELLDAGYRAVDPELKVRYIVTEAPADMTVTAGAQVRHSTQPPPTDDAKAPNLPVSPKAPTEPAVDAAKASLSPPADSAATGDAASLLPAQVIRQRDESPTAESPIHYRELALAIRPGASREAVEALMRARLEQVRAALNVGDAQQYVQIAIFDHMFVKRPVRAPIANLSWKNWRGDAVLVFPGFAPKAAESSPSSPAPASQSAPSSRFPSWTPSQDGAQSPSVPPAPVVAVTSTLPFAAPVVAVTAPLPAAAPAASGAAVPRPGPASPSTPPAANRTSVVPVPVVSVGVRTTSRAAPAAASPQRPAAPEADIPVPLVSRIPPEGRLETPREEELEIAIEVAPPSTPHIEVALESIPVSEIPVSVAPPEEAPPEEAPPKPATVPPPKPTTVPPPKPVSSAPPSSNGSRRRAAGEDLIGELFERMHELAFMADLVSGADFVLNVLGELIPCEGILVHVFDIDKRSFVVVRAHGPNARGTLLHRTAGDDPLVRGVMSRPRAFVLDGSPAPSASSSLAKLGIEAKDVLCGAARLGGRYLGMIELANPAGGQPFHDGEANALDYVCEQFAEFVASRPIVLDADVVVGQ